MTLQYLLPAVWGFVLIFSFIGYGALIRRTLFSYVQIGWANAAAWGMAFVIVLGGALSYVFAISRPHVLFIIAVGCALWIADLIMSKSGIEGRLSSLCIYVQKHQYIFTLKMLGWGCLLALAGVQYLNSVAGEIHGDDIKGYFTFADQMLNLGGFAPDPFNGYRLSTGLGGQSILHALVRVLFDYNNLTIIDGGVALIICIGLVLRIGQEQVLGYFWKWSLVLFFLSVPSYPFLRANSSSLTTGMVMFLALFAFLDRDTIREETPVRNACVIGLLATSACALKTNLIPPCVVILALSYLWYVISARFKKHAVLEALLVPTFVLIMLLPWMLSLYRSSGTLLYPVLGMGFDEFTYGNYLFEDFAGGFTLGQKLTIIARGFFSRDIYLGLLIVSAVGFAFVRLKRRAAMHAFALGSILAVIIILLKSDISNQIPFYRYLFVCVFISLIVGLASLMAEVSRRFRGKMPTTLRQYAVAVMNERMAIIALVVLLGMGCMFFGYFQLATYAPPWHIGRMPVMYRKYIDRIFTVMAEEGRMVPDAVYARYKKAQESVPAGEAILSRDNNSIIYHCGRNPIYNINDPGICSPPPGLPYFQGPEAVAGYLLSHNIRYVAYSYGNQAGYPVINNLSRHKPTSPYFHRITERAKVALDRVLGELGATRKRVFDDGELFILDLKTPAPFVRDYREPNYFQIGKILTLAWARTQGFDRNKVWTNGHGVIDDIHFQPEARDNLLVLNTFGYHPWKKDIAKLKLSVSVNGTPLPLVGYVDNSYAFSLYYIRAPITNITVDSSTFVPREEKIRFGKADDRKTLGIDVDTIQIENTENYFK